VKIQKNIIFIVHNYTSFQKDNIECLAKYIENAFVLVRYKPFSKIAKLIPISWIKKKYSDESVVDTTDVPENVHIIKTPVFYIPYGVFNRFLGYFHHRSVEKAIKKNRIKFDLIHAHFLWSSGYVGMKLKQKYNVPFVVTGHGYDVYKLPYANTFFEKKIKEILYSSDKIITVSQKNKEILLSLGIKSNKISVVFNGFNSQIFFKKNKLQVQNSLNINPIKKNLLTIGNLEKIKGHKYLISAIKSIDARQIHLYVIGSGRQEKILKRLVNILNLSDQITFVGQIPHNELNNWMNACDIFVLSSINEGLPTVILEALGCGKPVVSTNVGGIPEIIQSEKYGILVEKESPTQLSKAIIQSLEKDWDEDEILNYGNQHTVIENANKLLEIYNLLLIYKKE
jgi:glycosyltransferase involved in cell wall biosynthesis